MTEQVKNISRIVEDIHSHSYFFSYICLHEQFHPFPSHVRVNFTTCFFSSLHLETSYEMFMSHQHLPVNNLCSASPLATATKQNKKRQTFQTFKKGFKNTLIGLHSLSSRRQWRQREERGKKGEGEEGGGRMGERGGGRKR